MTIVKNQVLCFMGKEYSEKSSQVFCKNSSCCEFSPEFVAVRYFLLSVAPKCFIQMLGAKIVILDDFSRQNQSLLRRISRLELRNCRFLQNSFVHCRLFLTVFGAWEKRRLSDSVEAFSSPNAAEKLQNVACIKHVGSKEERKEVAEIFQQLL